jgi:O-antigen ligase
VEGHAANGLHDSSNFIGRQWRDFMHPAVQSQAGAARLVTAKGTRSDLYRVAIDGFEAHPLRGDGAGGFQVRWARTRRVDEDVRNAHSLELETLGELGLVGILLLLAFLGAVVVAAVRSRLRPGGLGRGQSAAVAAGFAVWLAHSFVDWDWQMPAFTGCALLLAAPLFPYGRTRRRRSERTEDRFDDEPGPWSRVGAWRDRREGTVHP